MRTLFTITNNQRFNTVVDIAIRVTFDIHNIVLSTDSDDKETILFICIPLILACNFYIFWLVLHHNICCEYQYNYRSQMPSVKTHVYFFREIYQ